MISKMMLQSKKSEVFSYQTFPKSNKQMKEYCKSIENTPNSLDISSNFQKYFCHLAW